MFAHTTKDFFPIRRRMIFPIRYCTENSLFPREVHNISTVSAICLRWLLLSVIFCQVRILRNSNKVFQKYLPIILQALHRYPRSLCIIWWASRQIGKRSALTENKRSVWHPRKIPCRIPRRIVSRCRWIITLFLVPAKRFKGILKLRIDNISVKVFWSHYLIQAN